LFYYNATLTADVIFPDVDIFGEPLLTVGGVFNPQADVLTPYSQVVAFLYDRGAGTLIQLDELDIQTEQGQYSMLLCPDCILPDPVSDSVWRYLVQD